MESAPVPSRAEVRVEVSPTLSAGSPAGASRPSTRATVRDGIMMRWYGDNNTMLRRPRTSSSNAGAGSNRSSAKMTKARFNVVVRKQKVTGLVKAIAMGASKPQTPEITPVTSSVKAEPKVIKPLVVIGTAAELSYEASKDDQQPFREQKKQLLRQYCLWNGKDVAKMDLPPLPQESRPKSRAGDAWSVRDAAAKQLVTNSYPVSVPVSSSQPTITRSQYQPCTELTTKSSHIYNNIHKATYRQRTRKSSALEEYKRISAMERIIKDTHTDDTTSKARPNSAVSTVTFCKTARPQTSIPREHTTTTELRLRRPASCAPRIRFKEDQEAGSESQANQEPEYSLTESISPPRSRASSSRSRRSCWLSPLEMCNVPADAKLKYIVNTEKKRMTEMMAYTRKLIRNEHNPLEWNDRILRRLMNYKPKLDPDEQAGAGVSPPPTEEEIRQNSYDELAAILDIYKDDPMLQKIAQELAANVEYKRQNMRDVETNNISDDVKTCAVNPLLLGSQTSKALVAGLYMIARASA